MKKWQTSSSDCCIFTSCRVKLLALEQTGQLALKGSSHETKLSSEQSRKTNLVTNMFGKKKVLIQRKKYFQYLYIYRFLCSFRVCWVVANRRTPPWWVGEGVFILHCKQGSVIVFSNIFKLSHSTRRHKVWDSFGDKVLFRHISCGPSLCFYLPEKSNLNPSETSPDNRK